MITLDYSAEKRADLYRKAGFSFLFYFFSFFVIYVDLRVKEKKNAVITALQRLSLDASSTLVLFVFSLACVPV